ncbi:MAG: hypothetical protein ABRQ25_10360 [Clostridiaceae bacterium]
MKGFNLKLKKLLTRKYLNIVAYLIFTIYMLKLITSSDSWTTKGVYISILLFFGFFAVLYEVLNILYNKAIKNLTEYCDPYEGQRLISYVQKYDIFKSFRSSVCVFSLLSLRDMGKPVEIINLLNSEKSKVFSNSHELLLIYHYSLFFAYGELGDTIKAKEHYNKLMELKDKKSNIKKINQLFSWNGINGYYKYLNKNFSESRRFYNKVITNTMNNREKINFYMLLARLEYAERNKAESKRLFTYIIENGNKMAVKNEANETILRL